MPPLRAHYFSAMAPKMTPVKTKGKPRTLPADKLKMLDDTEDNTERRKLKKQLLADESEKNLQQAEDCYVHLYT